MLLLALALLVQGTKPELTASVDHAHVRIGDNVILTVRAHSRSQQPLTIAMPSLAGFALVSSSDVTSVSMNGPAGMERVLTRELELRVERAGTLVIGPIVAVQEGRSVRTAPISIAVDSGSLGAGTNPVTRDLLSVAPTPATTDQVTLTLIASRDTVRPGEQLDIVAAAWFPRELRNQLRREPILTLPTPIGVWAYPPDAPGSVVASRLVRGHWMDLFVAHQTLFPLAAGRLLVPAASVEYAVPVVASILTREERYRPTSDSLVIAVEPLPVTGRPDDDRGVVAQDLTIDVKLDSGRARVGEPFDVTATIAGTGNVTLWPEPVVQWPVGFRGYAGETSTRVEPRAGRIAGAKTIQYLVVPDSSGSFVLPEVRYPYFDPVAGAYVIARVPPRTIAVEPGTTAAAARPVPPLLPSGGVGMGARVAQTLWPWGWVVLLLLPPLVDLGRRGYRRHNRAVASEPTPAPVVATRLGRLEREFQGTLVAYVADAGARDGDGLASALRAAGLERAVADHVVRLRDRLRATRYGPWGTGDQAELAAELEQVLRVLGAEPGIRQRRRVLVGLLLICAAASAQAQGRSPEALYQAGALRAAADSFAARAVQAPGDASLWYDLGVTSYREGGDGRAVAAWAVAARLAPRNGAIRRARALLAPPDLATERLLAVGVATPEEWALVAALGWILLWVALMAGRHGLSLAAAALVVGAGAAGVVTARHDARPLAVVIATPAPVRSAPYGDATAGTSLPAGAALEVRREYGAWLEVTREDGVQGWVLASEVVRL